MKINLEKLSNDELLRLRQKINIELGRRVDLPLEIKK